LGYGVYKLGGSFFMNNKKITLTYWGLWENENILTPIIETYNKTHPQIEIVYTKQTHKDYRERLQNSIEKGVGPDIFRFHNTWIPMLKNDLQPAGKTGYQAQEFQQTFYPVASQDLVIGSKVYGVPLMIDGLGLYYNEDLFRSAGVSPPTTWNEFKQVAQNLKSPKTGDTIITAGVAMGTANNVEHYSDIIALLMLQNGADLKNPISKEAQDALSYYRSFVEKPNNVWTDTFDNSILAFASGRVAMIFAPSWQAFRIQELNSKLKFQIIPVPQLANGNVTWASYWVEGVSSRSKYPNEAWEFIKYLSEKETMIRLYTEESKIRAFGEPYSRVDLAQTIINDPYVGAYIRQAQTAKSFFLASSTHDNGINDKMIKYLEDAINKLSKGVTVVESLDTVSKGFAQVLSSFGYTSAR
jgi:ABC-type glycerol-3-phosphate transport system substrate-binding protein